MTEKELRNADPAAEAQDQAETQTAETAETAASEVEETAEAAKDATEASTEEAASAADSTEAAPKAGVEDSPAETGTETAPALNDNGAHDDFDWDLGNKMESQYTDAQIAEMNETYDATFKEFNDNEIVTGTVMGITDSDVVLNIGFKSDGLVSKTEFRDMEDLKVGDDVEVYVVAKENEKGQLVLSRKNAKLMRAWETIADAYRNDTVINGTIISKTKGGLIVNVLGLETFLPGSQIDVKPIVDYDAYVGKKMEFKVVKINEAIKNAVVSHKALIESDLEAQRQEIIGKLEKGQVLEGTIKNITDFGAFIDLGGVDGLALHHRHLLGAHQPSEGGAGDPPEAQCRRARLRRREEADLARPQAAHPASRGMCSRRAIQPGSKVKGRIVNIEDYGAFLEITPGVEGLIHISEVSWSNQPINSKEFFNVGEEREADDRDDRPGRRGRCRSASSSSAPIHGRKSRPSTRSAASTRAW